MRFMGLLMVAGVIGFSNSAEGQEQVLDGGQGVIWVEGGIDSEVPENAIRVRVGAGFPLCRGTMAEEQGKRNWWRDIGVVKKNGKCHTLRAKKELRLQDNFYYLVPEPMSAEVEELLAETDEFIGEVDALLAGDDSVIDNWEDEIVEEHEDEIVPEYWSHRYREEEAPSCAGREVEGTKDHWVRHADGTARKRGRDYYLSFPDAQRIPERVFVKLFSHVTSGDEPDSQWDWSVEKPELAAEFWQDIVNAAETVSVAEDDDCVDTHKVRHFTEWVFNCMRISGDPTADPDKKGFHDRLFVDSHLCKYEYESNLCEGEECQRLQEALRTWAVWPTINCFLEYGTEDERCWSRKQSDMR